MWWLFAVVSLRLRRNLNRVNGNLSPSQANYGTWKVVGTIVQWHFASDLSQNILSIFLVRI